MKCDEVWLELSAYADSELPDDRASQIREHLSGCESCSRSLEGFSVLQSAARLALSETLDAPDLVEEVISQLPVRQERRQWRWAWALAAAACVIAALVLWHGRWMREPGRVAERSHDNLPGKIATTAPEILTPPRREVGAAGGAAPGVGSFASSSERRRNRTESPRLRMMAKAQENERKAVCAQADADAAQELRETALDITPIGDPGQLVEVTRRTVADGAAVGEVRTVVYYPAPPEAADAVERPALQWVKGGGT